MTKSDGGATATAGMTLAYSLEMRNAGPQDASGVLLSETVPAETSFNPAASDPGWNCSGAASGSTCSLSRPLLAAGGAVESVMFAVDVDLPLATGIVVIDNTATVADDGTSGADLDPSNNVASISTPVDASTAPDLAISKSDGGGSVEAGEELIYTLSVSNVGTQNAAGVEIRETVPEHTTFAAAASDTGWACTDVTPGSACLLALGAAGAGGVAQEVSFAVSVDSPLAAGVTAITNTATVADDGASGSDLDPSNNSALETTPIASSTAPDLAISKSDGDSTAAAGSTLSYTLELSNLGSQDATGVAVTETVPAETTFNGAASDPAWNCSGPAPGTTCTLSRPLLAAGESLSAVFAVDVDLPLSAGVSAIVNTANVVDDGTSGADLDPTNNTATVTTPLNAGTGPDLAIAKIDGGASVGASETLSYSLTVTNLGTQDASGVEIHETVPEHTTFAAAESDAGWACAEMTPGSACVLALGVAGAGGAAQEVSFAVSVDSPLGAGVTAITNTATVADDGSSGSDLDPSNNSALETTPIASSTAPDLAISKSDGGSTAAAGGALSYTLELTNLGSQDATGVSVTETVPAETTFNGAASDPGWSCSGMGPGSTCTLSRPLLAADESLSAVFAVDVDLPLSAGVSAIVNTASVGDDGASGADLDPTNNTATVTTPLNAGTGPDLAIAKFDGAAAVGAGETLSYILTVTNLGTQNATGVEIRETVPEHTVFDAAVSDELWQCSDVAAGSTCVLPLGKLGVPNEPEIVIFAVTVDKPLTAGATEIRNVASVADDGSGGAELDPSNNAAEAATPLILTDGPDLAIVKSDGGVTVAPGDGLVYALEVVNLGDEDAGEAVVMETVPLHTSFDPTASDDGWQCAGSEAGSNCSLTMSVAAGATLRADYAVLVDAILPRDVNDISNTATVSTAGDTDPGNDASTTTTPVDIPPNEGPDVWATMIDLSTAFGDELSIEYVLEIFNSGGSAALEVEVEPVIDPLAAYQLGSATASDGGEIREVDGPPASFRVSYADIEVGGQRTVSFLVSVELPAPVGVSEVRSQCQIRGRNFAETVSDDPDTREPLDPTATVLSGVQEVIEIPTLSTLGGGLLALLLGLAGARRLKTAEGAKAAAVALCALWAVVAGPLQAKAGDNPSAADTSPGAATGEGDPAARVADDEMVAKGDAEQISGLGQPASNGEIFATRRRVAGRMIVEEDEAGGAEAQGRLEDAAGLDDSALEGAAVGGALADEAMSDVEVEGAHDFLIEASVAQRQVVGDGGGSVEQIAARHPGLDQAASELDGSEGGGAAGAPEAGPRELRLSGPQQARQTADLLEKGVSPGRGVEAVAAVGEEPEELGVAERLGSAAQEPLARALGDGEVDRPGSRRLEWQGSALRGGWIHEASFSLKHRCSKRAERV